MIFRRSKKKPITSLFHTNALPPAPKPASTTTSRLAPGPALTNIQILPPIDPATLPVLSPPSPTPWYKAPPPPPPAGNANYRFNPEITSVKSKLDPMYKDDVLDISTNSSNNTSFASPSLDSISAMRAELLAVTDFNPLYEDFGGSNLTPHGSLVSVSQQALSLRKANLVSIVNNLINNQSSISLTDRATNDIVFKNIKDSFDPSTYGLPLLNQLADYHNAIESLKQSLDFYDDIKSLNVSFDYSVADANANFTSSANKTMSARNFISRYMQFTSDQVERFSTTKLYLQMMSDLRGMLETYSFKLFEESDPQRSNIQLADIDPFTIDKTYDLKSRFSLKQWIPSTGNNLIATRQTDFKNFYNLLPTNKLDRTKLLIAILSKEYRVSAGLGAEANKQYLLNFGCAKYGNPFDNIVGIPGDSIFREIKGSKSLSSLGSFASGENSLVFPFETKYIDGATASDTKKYIPGSSFLVDSILDISVDASQFLNSQQFLTNGTSVFNTAPLTDYSTKALTTMENGSNLIKNLLGFNLGQTTSTVAKLKPVGMFKEYLRTIAESTKGLIYKNSVSEQQACAAAVFKLASGDVLLRQMLFQHLLLAGILSNAANNDKKVFQLLGQELGTSDELNLIPKFGPGSSDLTSAQIVGSTLLLNKSAENIEIYIRNLIYRNSIKSTDPTFNKYSPGTNSPFGSLPGTNGYVATGNIYDDTGTIRNINTLEDLSGVPILGGEIKSFLVDMISSNSLTTPYPNLFSEFIKLADTFFDYAGANNNLDFLLPNTTRTRFNYLSVSGQLLMIFETLISLTTIYVKADFAIDILGSNSYIIYVNDQVQKITNTEINDYLTKNELPEKVSLLDPRVLAANSSTALEEANFVNYTRKSFDFSFNSLTGKWAGNVESQWDGSSQFLFEYRKLNTSAKIESNSIKELENVFGSAQFGKVSIGFHESIETALVEDTKAIEGILDIVDGLRSNFSTILTTLSSKFPKAISTWGGQNSVYWLLLNFFSTSGGDTSLLKYKSQLQLASRYLDNIRNQIQSAPSVPNSDIDDAFKSFFIGIAPNDREKIIMQKFFLEAKFLDVSYHATQRTKILSVGIPNGFSKHLSERISRTWRSSGPAKNFHKSRNTDIVTINIYKRDYKYDELVFKPKQLKFDLSLFQDEVNFNNIPNLSRAHYSTILSENLLYDYESITNARSFTKNTILTKPRYSDILQTDREQLFKNHLESYLLGRYINYVTNCNIEESTFFKQNLYDITRINNFVAYATMGVTAPPPTVSSNISSNEILGGQGNFAYTALKGMIAAYCKQNLNYILSTSQLADFNSIMSDPNVPANVKDLLKLIGLSPAFTRENVFARAFLPKVFERVFHVAVHPDDITEIDLELTKSTAGGRAALESSELQNKIYERNGKTLLRTTGNEDIILVDYFITFAGSDVVDT